MPPAGRVRPFVLALVIVIAGLLLDRPWWRLGLLIMLILFIEAFLRYRRMR